MGKLLVKLKDRGEIMFSSKKRTEFIHELENNNFDIIVIGGGITGAGIALDAAGRGLSTCVLEMQDFAAGTSSRSTKLIHGGLRYLKQLELKIVAEVGRERAVVYENGPHVTRPEWMLLPFYKGSTLGKHTTNIGLKLYDFLAKVDKHEQRIMLSPEGALQKEPLLKQEGLLGAGYYVEYKTDDARLTIEVLKKAVEFGVKAINYVKVIDLIYDELGNLIGVVAENQISKERHKIFAKKIINATGPWVDTIRKMDQSKKGKALHLTKGIHLVFSKEIFPLQQAIYFDTRDGRMIFAIPRDNKTYVGTTDTDYKGNIQHPVMEQVDLDYLLEAINDMFPSLNLTQEHVESSWAGLRPLIAEEGINHPSEISRKDEMFFSDSGLISMAGGKLTGYRHMAEDVVNKIVRQLKDEEGILYSESNTKNLPISGGDVSGSKGFEKFFSRKVKVAAEYGIDEKTAEKLIKRYGSNVDILFQIYEKKHLKAKQENMDPILFSELLYAIEFECCYQPTDFFIRRTGALFFDIQMVKEEKETVIVFMQKYLNWSAEEKEKYEMELNQYIIESTNPQ
jgi:glycerol-3-phosphate dehydrogenase